MFCPSCGVKNDRPGETVCFVCGKKLPLPEEPNQRARPGTTGPRPRPQTPVAARLGDRLIAVILDTLFIAAILLILAATLISQKRDLQLSTTPMIAGAAAAALAVAFLYYWLLEGTCGATIGKAIAGVRVVHAESGTPTFGSAAVRNALRLVEGIPFYLPSYFIAIFSRGRKRIGDFAANTVVLELPFSTGGRATAVALWILGIAASIWGTYQLCPGWFRLPR